MSITQYWRFVMGGVLVLLVVFMPQGLSGTIDGAGQPAQWRAMRCSPRPPRCAPLFETINVSKTLRRVQGAERCLLPRQ